MQLGHASEIFVIGPEVATLTAIIHHPDFSCRAPTNFYQPARARFDAFGSIV